MTSWWVVFAAGGSILLEGSPGTGKTTIAAQFLLEGASTGRARALHHPVRRPRKSCARPRSRTAGRSARPTRSSSWSPPESLLDEQQQQSLLYSSDLELGETTKRIFEAIEGHSPKRVVLDSLSEIRLLAQSSLRYRRQMLALKHYFSRNDATVLMLDDLTTETLDKTVHSVAHGVIRLEEIAPEYRRRTAPAAGASNIAASDFAAAITTWSSRPAACEVFPRLVSGEHRTTFKRETISSNSPALDRLLGGGIERGSSTLVLGPAGTGKSLLTMTFAVQAVERGEKAALFIFDEELGLLFERAKGLGIDLQALKDGGNLLIEQVDAAEMSPGEFSQRVRSCVESMGARTVVIDSLNGYQQAMPEEKQLILHMHELLQFLNRQGATTFLTVAQHGLVGDMQAPVDVTYLADTVVLLRYFEAAGRVRRAISIIKKRTSAHEDTIREYQIGSDGITLGEPLTNFQGVLRGVPEWIGENAPLNVGRA